MRGNIVALALGHPRHLGDFGSRVRTRLTRYLGRIRHSSAVHYLLLANTKHKFYTNRSLGSHGISPANPTPSLKVSIRHFCGPLMHHLTGLPGPIVYTIGNITTKTNTALTLKYSVIVTTHSTGFIVTFDGLNLMPSYNKA